MRTLKNTDDDNQKQGREPTGKMIDQLQTYKLEKATLAAQAKKVGERYDELDLLTQERLKEEGSPSSSGMTARATVNEENYPIITDEDLFFKYVIENQALYLFQRRLVVSAFQEMLDAGEDLPPGIEIFTRTKLSLRKTN